MPLNAVLRHLRPDSLPMTTAAQPGSSQPEHGTSSAASAPGDCATGRGRRVLVTGGAGFIGSHLIERLIARGDSVVVVDDLSTGRRSNLNGIDPARLTFLQMTVLEALAGPDPRLDGRFDEVYHLAAAVGVDLILQRPIESIETNVMETARLLRFAALHATPTLIASSSEVYGKSDRVPFREDDDVVYGPTIAARWSYACSKAIDEYLGLAHFYEDHLPVAIARLFNTVGPRQVGRYGMVLPRFVAAALDGRPLQVFGDGHQARSFCDVRDVVRVLPQLVANSHCHGQVFNVGHDEAITIVDLAHTVIRVLASSSTVELVPYETAYPGRGFEDLRTRCPDLTRLRGATGFAPAYALDTTIRDLARQIEADRDRAGAAATVADRPCGDAMTDEHMPR